MNDILGAALKDYQQAHRNHKLWIHNKYANSEVMPVSTYFRGIEDMPPLELLALEGCYGDVLDVGAGAGSHALVLQQRKINVSAIDVSAGATEVMQQRGVKKVVTGNIFMYSQKKFNTILLLMNGIGIAGTLAGLKQLLHALKNILKPGGHILCDSSDVAYLYEQQNVPQHYYGEIDYQYEYRNKRSDWFKWLYVDQQTLSETAISCGFVPEVLLEDSSGQYLARLTQPIF